MYTMPTTENMLDLKALTSLRLNDFESFEKLLFTETERMTPNFDRFAKFCEYHSTYPDLFHLFVPFINPVTLVQYQINHYILWGVLAYTKADHKPYSYFTYNTKEEFYLNFYNDCWACKYSQFNKAPLEGYCNKCPIYKNEEEDYECEAKGNPYWNWRNEVVSSLKATYAEQCMYLEWHNVKLEGYFGVQDCTADQLRELKLSLWEDPDASEIFEGLEGPEDIPDSVVFQHYAEVNFTSDDFFCSAGW